MAGVPVAPFLGAANALFQVIIDGLDYNRVQIANNHAATMAAIAANRAAAEADHALAMAATAANAAAIGANTVAIGANTVAIAANTADAAADRAAAAANHAAVMAALGAISRPFSFESHCSIVRTSNNALVDVHAVVTPLPAPAPVAGNPQLFPLQPPAWPVAGCTIQDLMRFNPQRCDQLIQAYNLGMHLPVQVAPVGVKVKRNIIMAHLGMRPWAI